MSKKMSMADMKEVRRIVNNILTDSLENIPVMSTSTYHSKVSIGLNIPYGSFSKEAARLLKENKITKEVSDLQTLLTKKKKELLKSLISVNKNELKEMEEDDRDREGRNNPSTGLRDDFNVLDKVESSVETTLKRRCEEVGKSVRDSYRDYLTGIESRTFDAYTKGMSADDFLAIVREEVKNLQIKALELTEELKRNGYDDSKSD